MYTKFHGILKAFSSRDVSHKVQLIELCAVCRGGKKYPQIGVAHVKNYQFTPGEMSLQDILGTCIPANFLRVQMLTDVPATCPRYTSLLHVVSGALNRFVVAAA